MLQIKPQRQKAQATQPYKHCMLYNCNYILVMRAQNQYQHKYTIWQAQGIDYPQKHAHLYWMQLYKHFYLLNYLNQKQKVTIVRDLTSEQSICFQGNIPRLVTGKIFKLAHKNEYFLLRQTRIPTAVDLYSYENENGVIKYNDTSQYRRFKNQLDEDSQRIAIKGYYNSKSIRAKGFSIFKIDFNTQQKINFQNYNQSVNNSIHVQFFPFQESQLNRFKIHISIKSEIPSNQTSFLQLFPDLKEQSKSLLQLPLGKKSKLQESNYITYNFQQPQQQRYFEFKEPHLALAFQGGGVKGVSYVGVYNQILKLQARVRSKSNNKIDLPVKSLIGSSAGGILSLTFTAGIAESELLQLCLMMDTFLEDILIQTEEQGQRAQKKPEEQFNKKNEISIKSGHFSGQVDQLRNVMHGLGLVEDSLFKILVQTLQQPSMQDKLIKILNPLVGSLASSLFTFKEQKNHEDSDDQEVVCSCCGFSCCCCCKSSVKDLKRINYYGFLYMALMSGAAIENIAAFCLVYFLKKAANQKDEAFQQKFDTFLKRKNFSNIITTKDVLKQADQVLKSYKQYKTLKEKLKKQGKRILKQQVKYTSLPLMKFAKQITMKEYYFLTGIEFTCTAVDLNDQIQRFFNHKTSPQLPLCKAVQMTGSVPVAFQSQRWKKQWGYYYIYHERTRRQVNLTDHNFTDGGLLANFPMRYLDNEQFRPMYFSHKLNQNTVFYGFGLEELEDFPQNIPQQDLNEAVNSFKKQFLLRIAPKLLKYLMCCSSHPAQESQQFQLINFLLSLVSAMQHADRKLNIQCFEPKIVHTKMPLQNEIILKNGRLLKNMQQFQRALKEFKESAQRHFKQQYSFIMYEEIKCLKELLLPPAKDEQVSINAAKRLIECHIAPNGIFSSALESYKKMLKKKNISNKFENPEEIFLSEEYKEELKQFVRKFQQSISKKQVNLGFVKNNCFEWCRQMSLVIQQIKENLQQNEKQAESEKAVFISQEKLKKLMNNEYRFTPFIYKAYKQKFGQMKGKLELKKISINHYAQRQIYDNYNEISNKVQKIINSKVDCCLRQCKMNKKDINTLDLNLHVILEAFSSSHYYYPQTIQIVQSVLTKINNQRKISFKQQKIEWKNVSIDIISCTQFHAIHGVLYVLGMSTAQIKQRMSQIKPLFQVRNNLNQQFQSEIWLKNSLEKLQFFLKRQWDQRFSLIEQEQQLQMLNPKEFQKQIKRCQLNEDFLQQHKFSQTQISTYLQKILHYVSYSFEQLNRLQPRKRKARISELLNFKSFKQQHQKYQKKGRMFLLNMMSHFAQQLIVVSQYIMKTQNFVNIKEISKNDDRFFKGMILHSLISAFQYKRYIYYLLKSKSLDPNITLQNFYHLAQKKILLNFTCIKVNQGRFQLVNMHTKPNMPLWAALMAAASLPFLLGNFTTREQWQIDERITNLKKAKANAYFNKLIKHDQRSNLSSYISGNFISTLPIQILSNSKVAESKLLQQNENCNQNSKIIEVIFAFEYQKTNNNKYDSKYLISNMCSALKGKNKFVNCWDFCKYFCQFLCCCCCSTQGISWYLSNKLQQLQVKKLLNMRITSNDNFIYHMYKRYLIKLPVRLGILEFDKITLEKPYLKDTIRQAQQVVRELTDTIDVKDNKLVFQKFAKNTSLEISFVAKNVNSQKIKNGKSFYYRIKFISRTIWRKMSGKYAIFYKIGQFNQFQRVQDDYFDIDQEVVIKSNQNIYLKYVYCSPQNYKIKERIHILNLSSIKTLSQLKKQLNLVHLRAVFRFPYRNILTHVQNNPLSGYWAGLQLMKAQNPQKRFPQLQSSPQIFIWTQLQNIKSTMFCLHEVCQRQKLVKQINPFRERAQCASCHSQLNLIVMDCRKCQSQYCLHCKIENFVVIINNKESSNPEICCTQRHSFKLENNQSNIRFCLYCDKYFDKIWKEQCGMTLCSNCLTCIPKNEIQDFIEEENSL